MNEYNFAVQTRMDASGREVLAISMWSSGIDGNNIDRGGDDIVGPSIELVIGADMQFKAHSRQ